MNENKKVGLFLDDVFLPDEIPPYIDIWVTVDSIDKFKEYIENYYNINKELPVIISLDGCLDFEQEIHLAEGRIGPILYSRFKKKTGLEAAKWLTEFAKEHKIDSKSTRICIHEPFDKLSNDIAFWFSRAQQDFNPITFQKKWQKKNK